MTLTFALYNFLIESVLLYGAEAWTMSKSNELPLGVFERQVLRKNTNKNPTAALARSYCEDRCFRCIEKSILCERQCTN